MYGPVWKELGIENVILIENNLKFTQITYCNINVMHFMVDLRKISEPFTLIGWLLCYLMWEQNSRPWESAEGRSDDNNKNTVLDNTHSFLG